jgi:hypothetical protein
MRVLNCRNAPVGVTIPIDPRNALYVWTHDGCIGLPVFIFCSLPTSELLRARVLLFNIQAQSKRLVSFQFVLPRFIFRLLLDFD